MAGNQGEREVLVEQSKGAQILIKVQAQGEVQAALRALLMPPALQIPR